MTKEQWQAIKNKDSSYDGQFFYVLRTTGTICRPSCSKKTSSPRNVIIFNTLEDALNAGYHLCKRCRPDCLDWKGAKQNLAEVVKKEISEHFTEEFSLDKLADSVHINKYHLLRTFRDVTGETPLQYHNRLRCEKAQEMLKLPELSVSFIASESGFNSASHFSRVFVRVKGKTPSAYRKEYFDSLEQI